MKVYWVAAVSLRLQASPSEREGERVTGSPVSFQILSEVEGPRLQTLKEENSSVVRIPGEVTETSLK